MSLSACLLTLQPQQLGASTVCAAGQKVTRMACSTGSAGTPGYYVGSPSNRAVLSYLGRLAMLLRTTAHERSSAEQRWPVSIQRRVSTRE